MKDSIQKEYDAQRNFSNKAFRSGCYAPFVSLYFNAFGNVIACCKNTTFVLGNVTQQRLDEIWNGAKINMMRKALANYEFKGECEFCDWQITGGDYGAAFPWIFEEFPVNAMEPEWPAMIEFAGSNTCNFECVMCSGEFSSSIRAKRERLSPLPKVYSDQFFQDLRKFLPHLKRAKFLGGEPFLARECFQIWDMIIDDKLDTPCHVTTNGSQYNAKVERVLEAMPISLSISIDGATKETNEKIRVNSNYEEIIKNVHRFREYTRRRGTWMSLLYCLMRQNWHEFGDILLFAESIGCEVFVNTVVYPKQCSLYTLPPEELAYIADEMEKQGSHFEGKLQINQRVWEDQVRKLRGNANEGQVKKLTNIREATFGAWRDDPTNHWHHIGVALEFADKGMYAEALEEVLKTSQTNPNYYLSIILCAKIRRMLGDHEGAEKDLDRAIKLSRRRSEAFTKRAWLRFDQNRLEEGIQDALHARELIKESDEEEFEVCEVLGFLYSRQQRFPEATQELDRLLALQPKNPKVRVQRGWAFQIAGMREQALKEAEAALALDPNSVEAIKLMEHLKL
jgi:radical SAM protein with 4Fe4S-binding SPASM domain